MHMTSSIFEFQIVRPNGEGMLVLERYRDDALCCDKTLWLDNDGAQPRHEFGSGASGMSVRPTAQDFEFRPQLVNLQRTTAPQFFRTARVRTKPDCCTRCRGKAFRHSTVPAGYL